MEKVILCGGTGTGKTAKLMNEYVRLVDGGVISSEKILVLLMNRNQSLNWRKNCTPEISGRIVRTSFFGFVQEEITTYYPLILKSVQDIKTFSVKPVFLTFETSQYLLSLLIEHSRSMKNAFWGLSSRSSRIAIDISSNFVKAAAAALSYKDIGKRLYSALEVKSEEKKEIFNEADEIISQYRNRCLECGVMDFAMAIDFYNTILLNNNEYLSELGKRFKYLIADNLEEAVPMQADLISKLLSIVDGAMIAYNPDGGYGSIFGGNKEYAVTRILNKCDVLKMNKPFTCKPEMEEFSQELFENILQGKDDVISTSENIIRMPEVQLRSDMLENAAEYIKGLISAGYKESEISVVSTFADIVTEYVLSSRLYKSGIKLTNISRKSRFIDNKFVYALVTLGYLCHPDEKIAPTKDDVRALINMVLDIDPIRSSILADIICNQNPFAKFPEIDHDIIERIGYSNVEKYNFVRNWINTYRDGAPMDIDVFFQRVFIELLLTYGAKEEDILDTKRLIDSAHNFKETVSRFNSVDVNKGFLVMIKNGVKSAESIFDMEERGADDEIILCTPMTYLSNSLEKKVIVLLGLSSSHWFPRCAKELSNPYVLTGTWDEDSVYSEETEAENERKNVAILMRCLMRKCSDRFVTFESRYSGDGYENDGILQKNFAVGG